MIIIISIIIMTIIIIIIIIIIVTKQVFHNQEDLFCLCWIKVMDLMGSHL